MVLLIVKSIILFFALLFLFAKWGPTLPISVISQVRGEPFIVSGEGKVSVTPDIAKISAGIEESGASLKTVQNSINTKSKNLVDALKKLGIEEKDIKTTSYSIFPEYDYRNLAPRITGYRASINYEVTIKDFERVNDALVVVTQNGANIVGGISFELNDETRKDKLQEARAEAVKEAKGKAEGLAKASGITLGKIINVSEAQGRGAVPLPFLEKMDTAGGEPVSPDIQPGETEIAVTVSLSYEVR